MSKSKALKTAAEALQATDEAVLMAKPIRQIQAENAAMARSSFESKLAEFDRVQGQLDKANQPTLKEQALLDEQLAQAQESTRIERISPNYLQADYGAQARTPEEFGPRLSQIRNRMFARDAVEKTPFDLKVINKAGWEKKVDDRYSKFLEDQTEVPDGIKQWASGTAYNRRAIFGEGVENPDDPVVFWHVDKRTDPRIEELNHIQFDPAANEFGLHIGSLEATKGIIGMDTDDSIKVTLEQFRQAFDSIGMEAFEEGLDVDPIDVFESILKDTRTQMFRRSGEVYQRPKDLDLYEEIIDTFEEGLLFELRRLGATPGSADAEFLKKVIHRAMFDHYDPSTYPLILNMKQGLVVPDLGPKNTAAGIAENFQGRGVFDDTELEMIQHMSNEKANVALRDLLERNGYDHLVYVNAGEDPGVMSVVAWKPETVENLYYPRNARNPQAQGGRAAISAAMFPLFQMVEEMRAEGK